MSDSGAEDEDDPGGEVVVFGIGIRVVDRMIRIKFTAPIEELNLTPGFAQEFARMLLENVQKTRQ